jgi:hypothetical protein
LKDLSQNFGCKNSDQNQNHGHLPRSLKISKDLSRSFKNARLAHHLYIS